MLGGERVCSFNRIRYVVPDWLVSKRPGTLFSKTL